MKPVRLLLLLSLTVRLAAATITVNGTGDTIAADGACTLREALAAANTNAAVGDCPAGTPGLDRIHFSIGAGGPQMILLSTPLPVIVEPVTIDGTTQPGFSGTPLVSVAATLFFPGGGSVFEVTQSGGGSTIRGLIITNGNPQAAIALRSSGNLVAGNYIQMSDGNTSAGFGGTGVSISATVGSPASNNTIGGVAPADRNVFGGFSGVGVSVGAAAGATADANTIAGNYFGWNAAKTAQASALTQAISLQRATQTSVIGNSIIGSLSSAISITLSTGTVVQSNEIGSMLSGNRVGVFISSSDNNIIGAATSGGAGGNVIVNNGSGNPETAGVLVLSGTGNRISGNSMSFNAFGGSFMGIDLFPYGPTPNDLCDPDPGANLLQNKPVLSSATFGGGMVTITGTLDSVPFQLYTIEFYANPPASGDQGHQYLGSANVTTDAACNATFTATFPYVLVPGGSTTTATSIDAANNTSEMSAPAFIVEGPEAVAPAVTKEFDPQSVPLGTDAELTITLSNPNTIAITGVAFSDNYPAGLQNAPVPNVTNSCGGTVVALPGGSGFSLNGGAIPANGTCSVSVMVRPVTAGTFVNDLPAGAVTSANAPPSDAAATATLTAGAATSDVPLSPAALMMLSLTLAAAGFYGVRQR